MAELFDKDPGLHLKNIYGEEELAEKPTTEVFPVVQKEENSFQGKNYRQNKIQKCILHIQITEQIDTILATLKWQTK